MFINPSSLANASSEQLPLKMKRSKEELQSIQEAFQNPAAFNLLNNTQRPQLDNSQIENMIVKIERRMEADEKLSDIQSISQDPYQGNQYDLNLDSLITMERRNYPPKVIEAYEFAETQGIGKSMKGLLSELGTVFITVDNQLFLWKIMDSSSQSTCNQEVFAFVFEEGTIDAVGTGKPTAEIFLASEIQNVLIIAFPGQIKMFEIILMESIIELKPLEISISVSSTLEVQAITCNSKGRIFIGCADTNVYEISYREGVQWLGLFRTRSKFKSFSVRNWLIKGLKNLLSSNRLNVNNLQIDNQRNLLYSEMEGREKELHIYVLGNDCQSFNFLGRITAKRLRKKLARDEFKRFAIEISSFVIVNGCSSSFINFIAVTKNALRIFVQLEISPSSKTYKDDFAIAFIRYPALLINNSQEPLSSKVACSMNPDENRIVLQASLLKDKLCVLEKIREDIFMTCYSVNVCSGKGNMASMEGVSFMKLDAAEEPSVSAIEPSFLMEDATVLYENPRAKSRNKNKPLSALSDFCQQVYTPPKFMIVTSNNGVQPILIQRPVDKLFGMLEEGSELKAIFPDEEMVVMHLQIAVDRDGKYWGIGEGGIPRIFPLKSSLKKIALSSLYAFLSKAEKERQTSGNSKKILNKSFTEILPEPSSMRIGVHLQRSFENDSLVSNGILIYLSRILRPIWSEDLKDAYELVEPVKTKFEFFNDLLKEEESNLLVHDTSKVLFKISDLVRRVIECLNLVAFFKEFKLNFPLRFYDLLNGNSEKLSIVQEGFTWALKMKASDFTALSEYCAKKFPSFYSECEETICMCEMLLDRAAREKMSREQIFDEVWLKIERIIERIDKKRLERLFIAYKRSNAFIEILKLCALKISSFSENEVSSPDIEFCQETLNSIMFELSPEAGGKAEILHSLSLTEKQSLRNHLIELLKTSKNDYLQKTLVYWLYREGNDDELMHLQSKHVKAALMNKPFDHGADFKKMNLKLYKYFTLHGDFMEAFKVISSLGLVDQAETRNNEFLVPDEEVIPLIDRIMYLNMSLQCLEKLQISSKENSSVLNEVYMLKQRTEKSKKFFEIQAILTEKIDSTIANINLTLSSNRVNKDEESELIEEMKHLLLLSTLLTRSEIDGKTLYSEFIEKLDAFECELLLFDCQENFSASGIENSWRMIITQTDEKYPEGLISSLKTLHLNTIHKYKIFPLQFLISHIERKNEDHPNFENYRRQIESNSHFEQFSINDNTVSPFWLPEFLLKFLNFPFAEIFEAYKLYVNSRFQPASKIHSINCLVTLAALGTNLEIDKKDAIVEELRLHKLNLEALDESGFEMQKAVTIGYIDLVESQLRDSFR